MTVDCFIDARFKTGDAVLVRFHADVAPGATAGTNGRRFLQIPDAHFEAEIPIRERAYRTDVHDIRGKRIIEHGVVKKRDGRMIAAVDDGQLVGLGNLLAEAHTARAL